jgi:predicted ester cyclase
VGEKRGREGFKQLITMYRTAFPDVRFTVTRWMARGTHRGELFGAAPTK